MIKRLLATALAAAALTFNATVALARRGSDKVRLSILKEMLDEEKQKEYHRRRTKDGPEVADEASVPLVLRLLAFFAP